MIHTKETIQTLSEQDCVIFLRNYLVEAEKNATADENEASTAGNSRMMWIAIGKRMAFNEIKDLL